MIMPVGQRLLLPAKPAFIWGSLVLAFFLNIFLNMALLGRAAWAPDLLAIVLIFWTVHQTNRVGIGAAFYLWLVDGRTPRQPHGPARFRIHHPELLCDHDSPAHALVWFAGLSLANSSRVCAGPSCGVGFAHAGWRARHRGGILYSAPVLQSLLWPLVSLLLFAPQHRAPNPDATRPI
jgi:rod shape-determining protein MreD